MTANAVDSARSELAAMVRAMRSAVRRGDMKAARIADWVLLIAPECSAAQRIKIDALISEADLESADAMLARGLLIQPCSPQLMLRRAASLCAQGRDEEADRELSGLLTLRPHWRRALRMAAETAERLNQPARAADLYERLTRLVPDDAAARERRIGALIDAGEVEQAEELLDRLPHVPRPLMARLRRRQGRLLDAIELIEAELTTSPNVASGHDSKMKVPATAMLLELLEEIGDLRAAEGLATAASEECSEARLHHALLLLRQGRFAQAAGDMARLRSHAKLGDDALRTLVVAAALSGRPRLSQRSLRRLQARGAAASPHAMIERWRRGMIGRFVRNQCSAKTAGADPSLSLLRPLISQALETFEAMARGSDAAPIDAAELRRHRAACLEALGG